MRDQADREQRWIAYLLGETPPEERARIEDELREAPGEAERLRAVVDTVATWAKAPVSYSPLRVQDLDLDEEEAAPAPAGRTTPLARRRWLAAATLAAAAAFLFALSQVSFTLQYGDKALHWGGQAATEAPAGLGQTVDALATRVQGLEQAAIDAHGLIQALQWQNAAMDEEFRNAALRLARSQRETAQIWYRDLNSAVYLAGLAERPGRADEMENQRQ